MQRSYYEKLHRAVAYKLVNRGPRENQTIVEPATGKEDDGLATGNKIRNSELAYDRWFYRNRRHLPTGKKVRRRDMIKMRFRGEELTAMVTAVDLPVDSRGRRGRRRKAARS